MNDDKFNFTDLMSDKKYRSRLILAIYLVVFVLLIVFVRTGSSNTKKNDNKKEDNNIIEDKEEIKDEVYEMFSLINDNNYEFNYYLSFNNENFIAAGKRYDNKYSFSFVKEGEKAINFLGTTNYIKAMVDDEEQEAGLPYQYLNYFDNTLLKDIIRNATKIDEENYTITNKKLREIASDFKYIKNDDINTIKLTLKNKKIIKIDIDYSNAVTELLNTNIEAKLTLEYNNFNLVDDFSANFE